MNSRISATSSVVIPGIVLRSKLVTTPSFPREFWQIAFLIGFANAFTVLFEPGTRPRIPFRRLAVVL